GGAARAGARPPRGARGGGGQQRARHVPAAEEEDQHRPACEQEEGPPERTVRVAGDRLEVEAVRAVGRGLLGLELARKRLEVLPGLGDRDPGLQEAEAPVDREAWSVSGGWPRSERAMVVGSQTSGSGGSSTSPRPWKPGARTPTTVYGTRFRRMAWPTIDGSAPKRFCQRPWERTTTGWPPSARLSSSRKSRPTAAFAPSSD